MVPVAAASRRVDPAGDCKAAAGVRAMEAAVRVGSCVRARRALSLVLDGEAVAGEAELLDEHLRACASCRTFALEISMFTRALRRLAGWNEKGEHDD